MMHDIVIPTLGESVTTAVILEWRVPDGGLVKRDDVIVVLETDKVNMEVPAPAAGQVKHRAKVGQQVNVGEVVGGVDDSVAVPVAVAAGAPSTSAMREVAATAPASPRPSLDSNGHHVPGGEVRATPLARKSAEEHGVDLSSIRGTGPGGRVSEGDVALALKSRSPVAPLPSSASAAQPAAMSSAAPAPAGALTVRRERMSMLRQRVAQRLVEAQHTAAMLTTFNEVDMTAVMDMRKKHKDQFEKKHGVGLGFMSFFVKACVAALKAFPQVNASIVSSPTGEMEVEFHDYHDISVAVGTPKGLVVPVLRDCDARSFAQVEQGVKDLAVRAKDGKLALADLQGGTFTITNGGIYGSLMSTPILNPPQTAILGMHAIKNRAVEFPVGSGQVAVRPMMYLALSYDHRLIDGADAVQFLVHVKNALEEPERILIGM